MRFVGTKFHPMSRNPPNRVCASSFRDQNEESFDFAVCFIMILWQYLAAVIRSIILECKESSPYTGCGVSSLCNG